MYVCMYARYLIRSHLSEVAVLICSQSLVYPQSQVDAHRAMRIAHDIRDIADVRYIHTYIHTHIHT